MLKNNNLYLRAPEPADLDFIFKIENDESMWEYSQTISPFSKHAIVNYIKSCSNDIYHTKQLRFMITESLNNVTVGMIDIYDFDSFNSKCAIGIVIDEKFRKNGYAYEAINLLKDYCLKYLSLNMIYAFITVNNEASIALFEKCGFLSTSILKDWIRINDNYFDVRVLQFFKENIN